MLKKSFFIFKITLLISLVFILIWGIFIEPNKLVVKRIAVKVPEWSGMRENLKIAVISDLHIGSPFNDLKKLNKIVQITNEEKPDVIFLLGDYIAQRVIGGKIIEPDKIAGELAELKPKYGMAAILGNHDWRYNGLKVRHALENAHIKVLENDSTVIFINKKPLYIAGLADFTTRYPDFEGAMKKIGNKKPVILLTHHPDMFRLVKPNISLTLAGHTHGGQIKIPVIGWLIIPSLFGRRYAGGHMIEQGRHLFVSKGIGTSILPIRIGNPPEIDILTISSIKEK